jgi:hypothetical protein
MNEIELIKYKITDFFNKNPNLFTEEEKSYILDCSLKSINSYDLTIDLIREVYDELNLLPEEKNVYKSFLKLLDTEFSIKDKNIIEVGGGVLPRLATRINDMQTTGKITVYDPRLSTYVKEKTNFKLVREKFNKDTNIYDTNLIIGFMPCKGAEVILDTALNKNLDFMVGLCEGGLHGDEYDYFETDDEWRHSLINHTKRKVKTLGLGNLEIAYQKEYGNPYPIIYNKRI